MTKPGVTTSEFWVVIGAIISGFLERHFHLTIAPQVATYALAGIYVAARTYIKAHAPEIDGDIATLARRLQALERVVNQNPVLAADQTVFLESLRTLATSGFFGATVASAATRMNAGSAPDSKIAMGA